MDGLDFISSVCLKVKIYIRYAEFARTDGSGSSLKFLEWHKCIFPSFVRWIFIFNNWPIEDGRICPTLI